MKRLHTILITMFIASIVSGQTYNYKLYLNGPALSLTNNTAADYLTLATGGLSKGTGVLKPCSQANITGLYYDDNYIGGYSCRPINYDLKNNSSSSSVVNSIITFIWQEYGVLVNNNYYKSYDYYPTTTGTINYKLQDRRYMLDATRGNLGAFVPGYAAGNPTPAQANTFCGINFNTFWGNTSLTGRQYFNNTSYGAINLNIVDFSWTGLPSGGICINAPAIDLRNYISSNEGLTGAVFSGPGVTNGYLFTPSTAGVGTVTLRAEKAYDNGTATKDVQLVVNDYNRESYFDVATITVCSDLGNINLDTVTKGHPNGTWKNIDSYQNGSSVNVTTAFGSNTGSLNKTYSYSWTNSKGCTNSQDFTFTISPTFIITAGPAKQSCDNITKDISTGISPSGGTWTSSNTLVQSKINGNNINVTGLAGGDVPNGAVYPLLYTVNIAGCIKSATSDLVVFRTSVITHPFSASSNTNFSLQKYLCNDLTNYNVKFNVFPKNGVWTFNNNATKDKVFYNDSLLNSISIDSVYKVKAVKGCGATPCEYIGTYTVVKNNCPSTINVGILINQTPTPPITAGASACVVATGSQSFTLTANSNSIGDNTLYWYSKSDTSKTNLSIFTGSKTQLSFNTPTISKTTTYYARTKDVLNGCYSAFIPTVATINTIPTVNAGADQKICKNVNSISLTGGSATIGSSPATGNGVWGGLSNVSSTGTFTNVNLAVGAYVVSYTYTTNANCSASAVKTVNVVDIPSVTIGQDMFLCGNVGKYKLGGTGESPIGGTWSIINTSLSKFLKNDTLNIDSLPPISTQTVKYSSTNSNGCTNSASKTITLYEVPTKPQLLGSKVCGQGSVTLSALGAKSNESYYWYNDIKDQVSFNQTPTFTTPTLLVNRYYYVSKKNLSGCEGKKDSVLAKVVSFTPVSVNSNSEIQICKSSSNTNLMQFASQKKGKFQFDSPGILINDSVFNSSTGSVGLYPFTYSYVNIEGCTTQVANSVRLSLNPTLILQSDTNICKNTKSFVLRTNIIGGKWSGSAAVDSVGNFDPTKLTSIGNYNLNYNYNKFGCNASGVSKVTLVDRPLTPMISGNSSGCENDSLTFVATSNENGVRFNFYQNTDTIPFSNKIITKVINTQLLNKVGVEAVNSYGCPSLSKAEIKTEVYTITGDFSINPTIVSQDEVVQFTSSVSTSSNDGIKSYDWNFGDSSAHDINVSTYHYYLDTTSPKVTLKVLSNKGCIYTKVKPKAIKIKPVTINIRTEISGPLEETYSLDDNNVLRLFPNPTNDGKINFTAYNALGNIQVSIKNVQGEEVYYQQYFGLQSTEFDISNQPAGIFFLSMKNSKGAKKFYKIIKQ